MNFRFTCYGLLPRHKRAARRDVINLLLYRTVGVCVYVCVCTEFSRPNTRVIRCYKPLRYYARARDRFISGSLIVMPRRLSLTRSNKHVALHICQDPASNRLRPPLVFRALDNIIGNFRVSLQHRHLRFARSFLRVPKWQESLRSLHRELLLLPSLSLFACLSLRLLNNHENLGLFSREAASIFQHLNARGLASCRILH